MILLMDHQLLIQTLQWEVYFLSGLITKINLLDQNFMNKKMQSLPFMDRELQSFFITKHKTKFNNWLLSIINGFCHMSILWLSQKLRCSVQVIYVQWRIIKLIIKWFKDGLIWSILWGIQEVWCQTLSKYS